MFDTHTKQKLKYILWKKEGTRQYVTARNHDKPPIRFTYARRNKEKSPGDKLEGSDVIL